MRYLIYFLFSLSLFSQVLVAVEENENLFYSAPDQLVSLTRDEHVAGLINPLSGHPVLRQTDLVAKGAQDVTLKRTYIPQYKDWYGRIKRQTAKPIVSKAESNDCGWIIFPHINAEHLLKLKLNKHKTIQAEVNEVRLVNPSGVALTFALNQKGQAKLACEPYGICNVVEDVPSGKYDFRNTKISIDSSALIAQTPDGHCYHYSKHGEQEFEGKSKTHIWNFSYRLDKEVLPNGKILQYIYDNNSKLIRVESKDPKDRYTYASIDVDSSIHQGKSTFSTNTGLSASYTQQPKQRIKKSNIAPSLNLLSIKSASHPFYRHEKLEFNPNNFLKNFSGENGIFACKYQTDEKDPLNTKVKKLLLPNQNGSLESVYKFDYDPPEPGEKSGSTTVRNVNGTMTIYEYSENMLLTGVKYYDSENILRKEKHYEWDDNQWLKKLEIKDGHGNLFLRRTFEYDEFGNPIREMLIGDLSGDGQQNAMLISKQFSDDGRHLLLREEIEGKIIYYSYLPGTHLITTKITQDTTQILKREFYEYDDANNLIKEIIDNGKSEDKNSLAEVSQRTITIYTLRQQTPFLHMPEWIEKRFLKKGKEKLLQRKKLSYDTYGNVAKESVFDAAGNLAYTIDRKYDEQGNLISESNPLGQTATYTYDDNGRCTSFINFSEKVKTDQTYDKNGRLTKVEEKGTDEITHVTTYAYDLYGLLIQKTDSFGNTTHYSYDPFSCKISQTDSPPITSQGKTLSVQTLSTYDDFGRAITKTDACGNLTSYQYNVYGHPTEIIYADGFQESFRYNKSGKLAKHTNQSGLITTYVYDVLNRVILKSYHSSGLELAKETFTYDGLNLLSETDREGYTTTYSYDGAGRLIQENRIGKVINYAYDPLNRVYKVTKENQENTLCIHYARDYLDQVLEKTHTDLTGMTLSKIAYTYDGDGNVSSIQRDINGKKAIDTYTYDSCNREIVHQDASCRITSTHYDEKSGVLKATTTDPKKISTVITHDPYGRVVKQEVLNAAGSVISSKENAFDPCGNLVQHQDHVYQGNKYIKTKSTHFIYDSLNRLKSFTRAFGTTDARETLLTYTPNGLLATKTMPDGLILVYEYDPFGNLSTLTSSDKKLHHTFRYNLLGQLLSAKDMLQQISIHRTLDPHGNVSIETLPNNISIKKTYDSFDRPLTVTLPDGSEVHYAYDPLFHRSVTRKAISGATLYTHRYETYDTSCHLLTENLIKDLGTMTHETDLHGRASAIACPYFQQSCTFDEAGNLANQVVNEAQKEFSYDDLYQLTSESNRFYAYDSTFNRKQQDGENCQHNALDEIVSQGNILCKYDLRGNLISKSIHNETQTFTYDSLNRLIESANRNKKVCFCYDPLGRRLSKILYLFSDQKWKESSREHYLYDGNNDIGAMTPKEKIAQLRLLGPASHPSAPRTVAIELDGKPYAPILDCQGNIWALIDTATRTIAAFYDFTAFGEHTSTSNLISPWQYASKRFDADIGLIDFGKRYYDSQLGRWLTTDPGDFLDSFNLYQFNFNNPFRYTDPDGRWLFLIPVFSGAFGFGVGFAIEITATEMIIGSILTGAALWGTSEVLTSIDRKANNNGYNPSIRLESVTEENEKTKGKRRGKDNKIKGGPTRDPETANYLPDPAAEGYPHTTLGTQSGRHETYTQGATFDEKGRFRGRTDVTDHGRPQEHPNPHWHTSTGPNSANTPAQAIPNY